ncbi:MAG: hypothetical protein ABIK12_16265 [Pseudomonadota bacterium]
MRSFTEKVKPPRSVFLDWPFGHPMGQLFNVPQQTAVLLAALWALKTTQKPGTIVDLPWSWN